jgi:hypothetical protein
MIGEVLSVQSDYTDMVYALTAATFAFGQLRRGHSVILPPSFSFVLRIPIRVTNSSNE